MKTCGIFKIATYHIKTVIGKPFHFIPFGDIHRDSSAFSHDYWERFRERTSRMKDAHFLCMGDVTDAISTSEKIAIRGLHDTTIKNLEAGNRKVVEKVSREIKYMRGRLIGVLGGTHYMEYQSGGDSDQYLAQLMDSTFLGVCAFVRIVVNASGCVFSLDVFAHHGRGGGATPGGQFGSIEKMCSGADADIYLMGHSHGRGAIPSTPRLRLLNGSHGLSLRERTPWLCRTGSFLRGYEPGKVSYVVDAGLPPSSLGWCEFEITPQSRQEHGKYVRSLHVRSIS